MCVENCLLNFLGYVSSISDRSLQLFRTTMSTSFDSNNDDHPNTTTQQKASATSGKQQQQNSSNNVKNGNHQQQYPNSPFIHCHNLLDKILINCSNDPVGNVHRTWSITLLMIAIYLVITVFQSTCTPTIFIIFKYSESSYTPNACPHYMIRYSLSRFLLFPFGQ